jgi:peroxiredoxin
MPLRFRFAHRLAALAAVLVVSQAFSAETTLLTINVTDSAGKPVAGAEAFLLEGMHGMASSRSWHAADDEGTIVVKSDQTELNEDELGSGASVTLVVRGPGHAWSVAKVTVPSAQPMNVKLTPGRTLSLAITPADGRAIPDELEPIIFAEGLSVASWQTNVKPRRADADADTMFNAAVVKRTGKGAYETSVPSELEKVWVLIHHPGYLRAFQAGPFEKDALESGKIEVELPAPATAAILVEPADAEAAQYTACGVSITSFPQIPEGGWAFSTYEEFADAPSLQVTLSDLPPGRVNVAAFTGARNDRYNRERADYFHHEQSVELVSGERQTVDVKLETFDEEALRARLKGDHTLTVTVHKSDGSPAVGEAYALAFTLRSFGRELTVQEGTVPASGEIAVEGLPDASLAPLQFSLNGDSLGWIAIRADESHVTKEFRMAPGVGELAPDIAMTVLADDSTIPLSSLRGQVVFLDFWASWCGPCQEPMKHNNEMMGRRTDWEGQAVIVGASIDNTIDLIKEHVSKHEWTNVLQVHCSEGEPGWGCDAVKKYAVNGVPTCFLIDRDGKVAWSGHPASIDVEAKIDELIKQ